jgi:DNA-directed RNA polymerase subunit K/omega
MESIMAKTFYYEELINVGINPYEAVIAASKEARRLNQNRLMSDAPEGPEKMTTVALERVVTSKVEVVTDYEKVNSEYSPGS